MMTQKVLRVKMFVYDTYNSYQNVHDNGTQFK